MKKLFTVFLVAIFALGSLFSFAACDIDSIVDYNSNANLPNGGESGSNGENESGDGNGTENNGGDESSGGNVTAHTHTFEYTAARAADCTNAGNSAYWYCTDCGKYFSDENGVNEIALSDTVIAPNDNHIYAEAWSSDENYHWHAVKCGHDVELVKEAHTIENHKCTVCNKIFWESVIGEGYLEPMMYTTNSSTDEGLDNIVAYENVKLTFEVVEGTGNYVKVVLTAVTYYNDSGVMVSTGAPVNSSGSYFASGSYAVSQKVTVLKNGVPKEETFVFEINDYMLGSIKEVDGQYVLKLQGIKARTYGNGTSIIPDICLANLNVVFQP